ncbi:carbon storage regulator CsrA [Robertmurraya korlensis]|uniref:carbon storage regulator CsrA n=1 Tax=Robertmurraya korlensis TaxID=519977 RepID=UPI00204238FF|nr:carbon storage regulator CsrA [Robertmurraya korlensis]MCM3602651.1 carbon storage regulator CsrA [Robertmurraya korlensis]
MLVLTRKSGESIKIGDDIEITILSVKNDHIKIGINAPKNLEILRKELLLQITNENVQASAVQGDLINILKKK